MGVIEEVGADVRKVKVGQRYVSCFDIGCGECFYCKHNLFSCCMRSNPSNMTCGLYGHKLGGFYGAPWHMSLKTGLTASTLCTDVVFTTSQIANGLRLFQRQAMHSVFLSARVPAGYSHITGGFPGGQAQYVRILWGETIPATMRVPHFADSR